MTSTPINDASASESEDTRFENAHGTVMVLSWMVFASTAILFARYGRTIRFGSKEKFLGEKNWFQIHRFLACLTSIATLLGFFLILVQNQGSWTDTGAGLSFVHTVLGGIIVCCALIQSWMALFRCHPNGSHRFIFNWLHRLTGSLAFLLSVPTIFIIITQLSDNQNGMIIILSIWSTWVVCIVAILEVVRYSCQRLTSKSTGRKYATEQSTPETRNNSMGSWNRLLLILFLLHIIVSIGLAIPLIVLIWTNK